MNEQPPDHVPAFRNGSGSILEPQTENQFPAKLAGSGDAKLFSTKHSSRLKDAIEAVYAAFAGSRLDAGFACCPCCFTKSDVAYLRDTPLRELSLDDAARILPSLVNTLGSEVDINYFLPRIFEAWAYNRHYLPEVIPDRIATARKTGWNAEQAEAAAAFVRALIEAVNELPVNTGWYYDLSYDMPKLKAALPEIGASVVVVMRDPDATNDGEVCG